MGVRGREPGANRLTQRGITGDIVTAVAPAKVARQWWRPGRAKGLAAPRSHDSGTFPSRRSHLTPVAISTAPAPATARPGAPLATAPDDYYTDKSFIRAENTCMRYGDEYDYARDGEPGW
ncbi:MULTISPECIES: hypothetical protein [Streptomyces]|uniref:hypothetical protein n=1 Tax=Streptomyces TaxID=1883 RepID=UPI002E258D2A